MLQKVKKSGWLIFFCLLAVGLTAYRWREWLYLPSHYVVEPYGDGIKSYLVPLYHIKFDSSYNHFEGMNYPFGEHIVAADGMATLSFPLKWLFNNGVDLTAFWPKIVHFSLLLSFIIGIFFLYRISLLLGLPAFLSGFVAISIAFLSPQLLRMEAHIGLAHLAFIPALIYYWLSYSKYPFFRSIYPIIFLTIIAGGIHFYYVAFILAFSLFFAFTWYLFPVKKPPFPIFITHLSGAVLIPMILLFFWVNAGNQPTDRCPQPWGFFHFNATPGGLFFSPDIPFWRWVDLKIFPLHWENFSDIERYHYMGLGFLFFMTLVAVVMLLPGQRVKFFGLFSNKDFGILALLIASFLSLFVALGLPFTIKGLEDFLSFSGPFRQFRSVGRFAWVFFYGLHLILAISVYRFFKGKKSAILIWGIYFSLLFMDISHYHRRLNFGLDLIPELEAERNQRFLTGIHADKFQAILTIPYYHVGSDQFWMEPEGFILQKSLLLSSKMGLPTNSAMLTRTSRLQTYHQMQWVNETYRYPMVLGQLNDRKPFLLMVDKWMLEKESGKRFEHLLRFATLLHDEERLALYSLPFNAFNQLLKAKNKEVSRLAAAVASHPKGTYDSKENAFFITAHWNHLKNTRFRYAGEGALKINLNSPRIVFKGVMPKEGIPGNWTLSVWLYLNENKRSTSRFTITERSKTGQKYETVAAAHAHFKVFDTNGWALAEIPWVLHESGSQIFIKVNNPDIPKEHLFLDELLLKPEKAVLVKKDWQFVWMNNRRYPHSKE
jgi:hypothetical protein